MLAAIGGELVTLTSVDVADKEVELILTRSIRRKLVIVLALVFAMVVLLSFAGLTVLYGHRHLLNHMRHCRDDEPRRDDLASAIGRLNEALVHTPIKGNDVNPFEKSTGDLEIFLDDELWDKHRNAVTSEFQEFYNRLDKSLLAVVDNLNQMKQSKLERIRFRLDLLDKRRQRIKDSEQRRKELEQAQNNPEQEKKEAEQIRLVLDKMVHDVADLQALVQQIPASDSVIDSALKDSKDAISWQLWLIGVPTLIVVVLFFSLIYCGYHWILIPIRQLHEAASRVANGDYTYRLKLRGKDEMAELGEMFNKMTERFQTDKAKLDQEVEVRSRQILRSERLAGIGVFASGIAHEINNPLQAIANAAESLTDRLREGSLGHELPADDRDLLATYMAMIERESTRCQQITSRVLDFARGTNGPKSRQDLTKIVTEVLEMVAHMNKFDGRKIVFDRSEAHPVDVSAAEMKQVVLNLVANGFEAMSKTGTLTIKIEELVDEVVLSVQDDGCGMTQAVIENLYEPFFTDKLNGKGTGLGLSITHRIVGDHGGRIEATSEGPGCGSTFRVHLPRCAKVMKSSAA